MNISYFEKEIVFLIVYTQNEHTTRHQMITSVNDPPIISKIPQALLENLNDSFLCQQYDEQEQYCEMKSQEKFNVFVVILTIGLFVANSNGLMCYNSFRRPITCNHQNANMTTVFLSQLHNVKANFEHPQYSCISVNQTYLKDCKLV